MCNVNMSETDVCEECALKCLLIHKKKRDPSSIVTSFFKVMINDTFLHFLPVPPRFAPRLASFVGHETRVEDSSGRKWTVALSNVNNCLGFERGWHAFSVDHGIELGDILIVHYILGSHFVVQIFGRSGCEKLKVPSENNYTKNKRIRTTKDPVARDGSCSISGKNSTSLFGSGLGVASIPSDMELEGSSRTHLDGSSLKRNKEESHQNRAATERFLDEPCLMMMDRDNPVTGEEERIKLFDMFAPEISNMKPVGKVDGVHKGKGLSNVEHRTDNRKVWETSKPLQAITDLCSSALNGNKHNNEEKHISAKTRARITTYERQVDELEPNTAEVLGKHLNAALTSAGEVRRIVKAEAVHHSNFLPPLEVSCLVTPDSESSLKIPKGLPFPEFSKRGKKEGKGVVL